MTDQSLAERRLMVLRDVADRTVEAKSVLATCELIAQMLAEHALDVPFAMLYLLDSEGRRATLAGCARLTPGSVASPYIIDFAAPSEPCWPILQAMHNSKTVQVDQLQEKLDLRDCGPYPEPPRLAFVLPITISGITHPFAITIAGVSPRRALDATYRTFYSLLRAAVSHELTKARAYDQDRQHTETLAEFDPPKSHICLPITSRRSAHRRRPRSAHMPSTKP